MAFPPACWKILHISPPLHPSSSSWQANAKVKPAAVSDLRVGLQSGDVTMGSNLEDAAKMTPCESYRGEPCTTSGSQPYRVSVSPGAELLMDVHAHLSKNEVAGLLAGSWDAAERLLRSVVSFLDLSICQGNLKILKKNLWKS